MNDRPSLLEIEAWRKIPYPPDHYYSPINDPKSLDIEDLIRARTQKPADVSFGGVKWDLDRSRDLLACLVPTLNRYPFPETKSDEHRYFWRNGIFEYGDSAILLGMLGQFRPDHVVEVGSGFSSACMLDATDFLQLETKFTFIEPDAARLRSLIRRSDAGRCTIIERNVQGVELTVFEQLTRNDLLFIDSSHVSKAGSDVNFELFEILPRLQSGVIVHFHDIFFPFEYPADWIFNQQRSWNEIYLLRAFLMFNNAFDILYFNDAVGLAGLGVISPELDERVAANVAANPGGGLWLQRV